MVAPSRPLLRACAPLLGVALLVALGAPAAADSVPSAPRDLAASTAASVGQLDLTWSPPADMGGTNLSGYKVYRGNTSGNATFLVQLGNVTGFADTALPNGTVRYYQVSALNGVGEGPLSNETSAGTLPGAPRNFTALSGPGVGQIQLFWQVPSGPNDLPVLGYRVYRGNTSADQPELAAEVLNATYLDSGLPNGATRFYRVSALNSAGEGPRSAVRAATTYDLPTAPRDAVAVAGPGVGEIRVSWSPPASSGGAPLLSYRLSRGEAAGNETLLAELAPNVTRYADSGLPNGAQRFYRVSATNFVGEGPSSARVNATTFDFPSAPRSLTAGSGPGVGQITLGWQPPASSGGALITAYRVYRGETPGNESFLTQVSGAMGGLTDTGLPNGAHRFYRVAAANIVGEGPRSNGADAFAPDYPGPPRNLTAVPGPINVSRLFAAETPLGRIQLRWEAPVFTGHVPLGEYRVFRGTGPGDLTQVATLPPGVLSYLDRATIYRPYFYEVRAVNVVGPGPASNLACSSPAPWYYSLQPVTAAPCPLPAGWEERRLLDAVVPLGLPAGPGVDAEVLSVDGHANASDPDYYDLGVGLAGQRARTLTVFTAGTLAAPLHAELLHVSPAGAPASSVAARVTLRHDPGQVVCLASFEGTCIAPAPVPNTSWPFGGGARAVLVVELEARDAQGNVLASQVLTLPYAGQAGGYLP